MCPNGAQGGKISRRNRNDLGADGARRRRGCGRPRGGKQPAGQRQTGGKNSRWALLPPRRPRPAGFGGVSPVDLKQQQKICSLWRLCRRKEWKSEKESEVEWRAGKVEGEEDEKTCAPCLPSLRRQEVKVSSWAKNQIQGKTWQFQVNKCRREFVLKTYVRERMRLTGM